MASLEDAGHQCLLACRANSGIAEEATRRGLVWHAVSFRNSVDWSSVVTIRRLIGRFKVGAVICHSGHDANIAAIAVRLFFRRPALIRMRTYLAKPARRRTVNVLADLTLVPSEYLRNLILADKSIDPKRVSVLRPLLPLDSLRADAKSDLPAALAEWFDEHSPVIAQVAMLRSEKGHRLALSAMAILRERFPRLGYLIAGSGSKENHLRKHTAQLGIDRNVHFAGLVIPAAPLMARSDLVIMPSLNEPLGLAQLEALALGIPVAVSDAGGLPETVIDGETGWIIPANDAAAWSENLAAALNNPSEARRRAKSGQKWVERVFSSDVHRAALLQHMASVCSSNQPADRTAGAWRTKIGVLAIYKSEIGMLDHVVAFI